MKTCSVINCENTNIVYSGIDAFMLGGIPTETYCYTCATAYLMISESKNNNEVTNDELNPMIGLTSA